MCRSRPARRRERIRGRGTLALLTLAVVIAVTPTAEATPKASHPARWLRSWPAPPRVPRPLRTTIARRDGFDLTAQPLARAPGGAWASSPYPTFMIRLLAPIPHSAYRMLQFNATTGSGVSTFDALTFQFDRASNSDLTYSWTHRMPETAVRVGRHTQRAHLTLDSGLATANLWFTPTRPTHRRTFGCDAFLAPKASTVKWTIGRLHGRFSFTPREAFLRTEARSVRAAVVKIIPTGERCPPEPRRCFQSWMFDFHNEDTFVSILKFPPGSRNPVIDAIRMRGSRSSLELQWVSWIPVDTHPVGRTATSVALNASNAGPFLTGRISFERDRRLATRHRWRCKIERVGYAWASGEITMNLEAGPVTVTGSGLHARSLLFTRR